MSNYTISVDWDGKDALADSNAAKVISGDDFQTEFETVQTAVNSKANLNGSSSEDFAINSGTVAGTLDVTGVTTLGGNPTTTTQSAGNNTTRIATTAFVTTAVGNATVTAAEVNALVYPVGSLYFNMASSTNPNTLLGMGTWVAYAEGEVLVGKEASGTFDTLDESLGAETVSAGTSGSTTLSTSQMPAHTHTIARNSNPGGTAAASGSGSGGTWTTSSTGGGSGHTHTTPAVSTLQPSVTVYIWKRTA